MLLQEKRLLKILIVFSLFLVGCQPESIRTDLRKDLGFQHGSPYIGGVEVFTFEKIISGGLMDKAGFKSGDIINSSGTIVGFYGFLEKNRGKIVTILVKRNDGSGIYKTHKIKLSLPK